MKANKYQRLAMRTANLDLSPEECLLNAVLGLAGESGELCKILSKVSLDDGDSLMARYILLQAKVGELGDTIKKHVFHGHPIDKPNLMHITDEVLKLASSVNDYTTWRDIEFDFEPFLEDVEDQLADELGDAQWYIVLGCYSIRKKLSDIMRFTISKLLKRYPDKFSFERSMNRDA